MATSGRCRVGRCIGGGRNDSPRVPSLVHGGRSAIRPPTERWFLNFLVVAESHLSPGRKAEDGQGRAKHDRP
jgi:hypothetical protein